MKVVTTAAMSSFTCGQPQQNGSFFRIKRRETIFCFEKTIPIKTSDGVCFLRKKVGRSEKTLLDVQFCYAQVSRASQKLMASIKQIKSSPVSKNHQPGIKMKNLRKKKHTHHSGTIFEQLPWYFAKRKEQIWNHITLPGNDHISPLKVGKMRFSKIP